MTARQEEQGGGKKVRGVHGDGGKPPFGTRLTGKGAPTAEEAAETFAALDGVLVAEGNGRVLVCHGSHADHDWCAWRRLGAEEFRGIVDAGLALARAAGHGGAGAGERSGGEGGGDLESAGGGGTESPDGADGEGGEVDEGGRENAVGSGETTYDASGGRPGHLLAVDDDAGRGKGDGFALSEVGRDPRRGEGGGTGSGGRAPGGGGS